MSAKAFSRRMSSSRNECLAGRPGGWPGCRRYPGCRQSGPGVPPGHGLGSGQRQTGSTHAGKTELNPAAQRPRLAYLKGGFAAYSLKLEDLLYLKTRKGAPANSGRKTTSRFFRVPALSHFSGMSVWSGQSPCIKILWIVHCIIYSFLIILKIKK
jgi:hypothetical protein